MGIMIAMKGKYENSKVIENVVRYITRTRSSEKRGDELLAYGSHGVAEYLSVEVMTADEGSPGVLSDRTKKGEKACIMRFFRSQMRK